MRTGRERGFTLAELLLVVVLIGVCCALAVPSVAGMVSAYRARGAAAQFTGDLYYARMLAVKSGRGASLRVVASAGCAAGPGADVAGTSYVITLRTDPQRVVRTGATGPGGVGACVESNRSDSISFDSRGLLRPPGNRTVWFRSGSVRDSLSISVVGRVLPRF